MEGSAHKCGPFSICCISVTVKYPHSHRRSLPYDARRKKLQHEILHLSQCQLAPLTMRPKPSLTALILGSTEIYAAFEQTSAFWIAAD